MIDLHPVSSGFPIASAVFWCLAEGFQFVKRFQRHVYFLRTLAVVFSVLGVVLAFVTGYTASSTAGEIPSYVADAVAYHHAWGKFVLVDVVCLAALYYLMNVAVHARFLLIVLYYLAGVLFVVGTFWVGHLGGELVFSHGVNVMTAN